MTITIQLKILRGDLLIVPIVHTNNERLPVMLKQIVRDEYGYDPSTIKLIRLNTGTDDLFRPPLEDGETILVFNDIFSWKWVDFNERQIQNILDDPLEWLVQTDNPDVLFPNGMSPVNLFLTRKVNLQIILDFIREDKVSTSVHSILKQCETVKMLFHRSFNPDVNDTFGLCAEIFNEILEKSAIDVDTYIRQMKQLSQQEKVSKTTRSIAKKWLQHFRELDLL